MKRTIWIAAPVEQVWQALTTLDHIIRWLVPNLPFATMKVDDNGKITIHLSEMGVDFITLEAVESLQHLTLRGLPDGVVTGTFTLESGKEGTTVTVTLAGFEGLLGDANAERLVQSGTAWEQTLQNLKAFVDGTELPYPQAFVGPLFGYWREADKEAFLERSIWIAAPRERVWRAITDPTQFQQWYSPVTPWTLSALEIGGRLSAYDSETNSEKYVEIIEVLDPPSRLGTRAMPEAPDTITKNKLYTLMEENGGTRLSILLTGYEQEPDSSRGGHMEQDAFGFGMVLQNIKAYLEGESLPFPWGF
jgi:uncharacterized protein YndB with AHSA1/START domain